MQVNICPLSMFLSSNMSPFLPQDSLPFNPPMPSGCTPVISLSHSSEEPIPIVTGHPHVNSELQQVPALQRSAWACRQHQGGCAYVYIKAIRACSANICTRQVNTDKNALRVQTSTHAMNSGGKNDQRIKHRSVKRAYHSPKMIRG